MHTVTPTMKTTAKDESGLAGMRSGMDAARLRGMAGRPTLGDPDPDHTNTGPR